MQKNNSPSFPIPTEAEEQIALFEWANHGLYIELKRQRGGRISEEQVRWINGLLKQGYAAAICKGWQEAASVITDYLRQKTEG